MKELYDKTYPFSGSLELTLYQNTPSINQISECLCAICFFLTHTVHASLFIKVLIKSSVTQTHTHYLVKYEMRLEN